MSTHAPLWRQVLDDLVRRLEEGEFAGRFPTDKELMATYSVSRHTVREAVRRLQMSGMVSRHPGRGSFVDATRFEQPLGTVYSLFDSIEATGAVQNSVVLVQETVIDGVVAERLGLAPDEPLFLLERVRMADGDVLAHDRVWLSADRAAPLAQCDFTHTALYGELRDRCGVSPEEGREIIVPVIPDEALAKHLELDPGEPVFEVTRLTSSGGVPLEFRVTLIRGDRYRFVADWSRTDSHVVPRMQTG